MKYCSHIIVSNLHLHETFSNRQTTTFFFSTRVLYSSNGSQGKGTSCTPGWRYSYCVMGEDIGAFIVVVLRVMEHQGALMPARPLWLAPVPDSSVSEIIYHSMSRHCCSPSPAVAAYRVTQARWSWQVKSCQVRYRAAWVATSQRDHSRCQASVLLCFRLHILWSTSLSTKLYTSYDFVFPNVIVVECSYKCISFSVSGGSVLLTPGVGRAPPHSTCHPPGSQCSCNKYKLCRPPGKYMHII